MLTYLANERKRLVMLVSGKSQRERDLGQVDHALYRIAESSFRGRDLALEDLKWATRVEVSEASYPILSRLVSNPLRLTDLAAALHISAPAVSRQVQILHSKGLIERTPDETDARATILRLTPKGTEVAAEAATSRITLLRQVLADWNDEDVQQLAPILGRLADELAKWDHRSGSA